VKEKGVFLEIGGFFGNIFWGGHKRSTAKSFTAKT